MTKTRGITLMICFFIFGLLGGSWTERTLYPRRATSVPPFEGTAEVKFAPVPNLGYMRFEVDGMPCIVVGRLSGVSKLRVWSYDGVTCDWSKRKVED